MKKRSSKDDTAARDGRAPDGRWEFKVAGDTLMALGGKSQTQRVAYRTATGELRFLPK